MPELPEVEVTRRGIVAGLTGTRIVQLWLGLALRWPLGVAAQTLSGRSVTAVRRRGKYLLIDLDRGLLLLHLGMSGSLRFDQSLPPRNKHDHMDLVTTGGTLRLHDPRRFGAVVYGDDEGEGMVAKLLEGLGVEPLSDDFSSQSLQQGLQRRTTDIKHVLLEGKVVVGVGNIYACEALFRARIRPDTPARSLTLTQIEQLYQAIVAVLTEGLNAGGATVRNFLGPHGRAGHFQQQTRVYAREGQGCYDCGTAIVRVRQAQRSSYFCPRCQSL